MDIQLTPENEQFLNDQLARGSYHEANAVLNAGLELLRRRDEIFSKIDRGCEQLEEGGYAEYTREELREQFDELKRRAMRSSSNDPTRGEC